jgi:beta-1,4-galactosyltransferase 2
MGDDQFNRGSLINAGFLYAKSHAAFDCYIFHDVDQIPLDDRDFYTCLTSPRHIAGFQEHRNNR